MLSKRVFFVASGRLIAYRRHGRQLPEVVMFTADQEGLPKFELFLETEPPDPVHLLVDLVEEEFREDTIPHVFTTDRKAVIRNKKNRLFRDPRYAQAIIQGRETTGRRDDKILFTSITRPELLAPWLALLAQHKIPVAGIYSLPTLSQALLSKIPAPERHVLLVTMQSTSGLRQTFFEEQKLKVSRLAVMPRLDASEFARYILEEIEKTRRYLNSLRLVAQDAALDVYIVSERRILTEIARQAAGASASQFHLVDVADIAHEVGIKPRLETPYSDLVFAQLLARKTPRNHYATSEETRYFKMDRARFGMIAASVLLLLGSVIWSGFEFVRGVIATQQSVAVSQQVEFYKERYKLAKGRLPPSASSARDLKSAVDAAQSLKDYKASPSALMAALSRGMDSFPNVRIESLDWAVSADKNGPVSGRLTELRGQSGAASSATTNSNELYQLGEMIGLIEPFDGDYRRALGAVNGFADTLSRLPTVEEVTLLSLPLNTSPDRRLEGTARGETEIGKAEFRLRLVLKAQSDESG